MNGNLTIWRDLTRHSRAFAADWKLCNEVSNVLYNSPDGSLAILKIQIWSPCRTGICCSGHHALHSCFLLGIHGCSANTRRRVRRDLSFAMLGACHCHYQKRCRPPLSHESSWACQAGMSSSIAWVEVCMVVLASDITTRGVFNKLLQLQT